MLEPVCLQGSRWGSQAGLAPKAVHTLTTSCSSDAALGYRDTRIVPLGDSRGTLSNLRVSLPRWQLHVLILRNGPHNTKA